ncbi:MAG: hypothetical protein K8F91_12670, partial [Candidatus Obscuribacterales bacterium]|nr:hypothetical protein [Candidatus Obscuribacterales bacterium]
MLQQFLTGKNLASKATLAFTLALTSITTNGAFAEAKSNEQASPLIAQSPYVQTYGKEKAPQQVNPTKTSTTSSTTPKTGTEADKSTAATAKAKPKGPKLIGKPIQHVCSGGKWQQFSDYIILKPGEEKLPLTYTVLNGSGGAQPLRGLRATLSGRELFKEGAFKGKRTLSIDMTGALTSGSTQIIYQAFGPAGSAFKWQLSTTAETSITGLSAKKASPGDSIKA